MTASETPVPLADKPRLAAMMRDYVAEMATIIADVDPDQPYAHFDLYWSEPDARWPFWLLSDDARAGFASAAIAKARRRRSRSSSSRRPFARPASAFPPRAD